MAREQHTATVRKRQADPEQVVLFPDQSEGVYEHLLYELPVMLHGMDGEGRLVTVNRCWLNTLGYTRAEVIGRHVHEFMTPESVRYLQDQVYPQLFKTARCKDIEVTYVRKHGQPIDILFSSMGYRNAEGRVEKSISVLMDVTGRRAAENALRRSEQRFRGSFETAGHGMALVAPTGRIVAVNQALTAMLGRSEELLLQLRLHEVVQTSDQNELMRVVGKLLSGETPSIQQEVRYRSGDRKTVWGLTSISIVRDELKRVDHLVVQIVDITSRRESDERLRQAQRIEAVGQLTGGIAHDFNNLLTVVIGNLQLLEGALKGNEQGQKRAGEAMQAAQRGSDLTRQLLAFSRRQTLEPQEVKANDLVARIAPLIERTIGGAIELKTALMAGDPRVVVDPTQLESSILNLGINARDAMPKGGRLTLETEGVYLDDDYTAEHPEVHPGHYVMIAVSDTGTGMPAHIIEKVFQPFFTTKEPGKGSGLGLSMVYGFIKQSGGHIKIYSEEGHGTSIKMYLPRRFTETESAEAMAMPAAAPESRKATILVAEDHDQVRSVAVCFLTEFGYEVIEARDGIQALSILQERTDIDLLFTDVVMPGGMNGFDLSQAAQQLRPDLKIIHTSGYPKGAMEHQEEPRLKDNLIMKPYRREELERIVRETLEGAVAG